MSRSPIIANECRTNTAFHLIRYNDHRSFRSVEDDRTAGKCVGIALGEWEKISDYELVKDISWISERTLRLRGALYISTYSQTFFLPHGDWSTEAQGSVGNSPWRGRGFWWYSGVMRDNALRIVKGGGPLSQCKRKIRAANVNAHRTSCIHGASPDFLLTVLPNI